MTEPHVIVRMDERISDGVRIAMTEIRRLIPRLKQIWEERRANAIQRDRAFVLGSMPGFRPQRWYTHGEAQLRDVLVHARAESVLSSITMGTLSASDWSKALAQIEDTHHMRLLRSAEELRSVRPRSLVDALCQRPILEPDAYRWTIEKEQPPAFEIFVRRMSAHLDDAAMGVLGGPVLYVPPGPPEPKPVAVQLPQHARSGGRAGKLPAPAELRTGRRAWGRRRS